MLYCLIYYMLSLKGRQNNFRLMLPDEFIPDEIKEKYTKVLKSRHSFVTNPIDFVNESIQKIQVLGFNSGTIAQPQTRRGTPTRDASRIEENNFLHGHTDYIYRSTANPEQLIDKTLNIDFRHTIGYINYFILFESFFYQYSRDTKNKQLPNQLFIDIYNEMGEVYARIALFDPLIDGMDMLDLDFTQPIAQSQTFRVVIKYSNIDFQFIENDYITTENTVEAIDSMNTSD